MQTGVLDVGRNKKSLKNAELDVIHLLFSQLSKKELKLFTSFGAEFHAIVFGVSRPVRILWQNVIYQAVSIIGRA